MVERFLLEKRQGTSILTGGGLDTLWHLQSLVELRDRRCVLVDEDRRLCILKHRRDLALALIPGRLAVFEELVFQCNQEIGRRNDFFFEDDVICMPVDLPVQRLAVHAEIEQCLAMLLSCRPGERDNMCIYSCFSLVARVRTRCDHHVGVIGHDGSQRADVIDVPGVNDRRIDDAGQRELRAARPQVVGLGLERIAVARPPGCETSRHFLPNRDDFFVVVGRDLYRGGFVTNRIEPGDRLPVFGQGFDDLRVRQPAMNGRVVGGKRSSKVDELPLVVVLAARPAHAVLYLVERDVRALLRG